MVAGYRPGKVCVDMRMLAVFEKGERIRHIGHLDIQRSIQRGLRRSGLPVAYSQGYNPHILLSFASALSTGACGKREIMDVTMAEEIDPKTFVEEMNKAMPPEMRIIEARIVDHNHPSLMGALCAAEYDIMILDREVADVMLSSIPDMMKKEKILAMRKTKTKLSEVDIKRLILSISCEGTHLHATLVLNEHESCKPQMLLEALKAQAGICEEVRVLITRNTLMGKNENGELVPLEKL